MPVPGTFGPVGPSGGGLLLPVFGECKP